MDEYFMRDTKHSGNVIKMSIQIHSSTKVDFN